MVSCVPRLVFLPALLLAAVVSSSPASAQKDCGEDGSGFQAWLGRFKASASKYGISQRTLARGLDGVTYDPNIIRLDRNQKSFKLSFEEFYARRAGPALIKRGAGLMKKHADVLQRIEREFGVPPAVIVSIWGLETNYGSDKGGKLSIVRSVATLAYDCRRPEFFHKELVGALQIIEKGDMTPAEMVGGWAGEIGQTQFLPSAYVKYGVDYDGDGRRDLVRSIPDLLASTANFLKAHGWQKGVGWLPGEPNYAVIKDWNKAEVYARTIAVMSTKLNEAR